MYQLTNIIALIDRCTIAVEINFLHHVLKVFLDSLLGSTTTLMEHKLGQAVQWRIVTKYPFVFCCSLAFSFAYVDMVESEFESLGIVVVGLSSSLMPFN